MASSQGAYQSLHNADALLPDNFEVLQYFRMVEARLKALGMEVPAPPPPTPADSGLFRSGLSADVQEGEHMAARTTSSLSREVHPTSPDQTCAAYAIGSSCAGKRASCVLGSRPFASEAPGSQRTQ